MMMSMMMLIIMLMMRKEDEEKEEKEKKDMLREKSSNPNLKGGEQTKNKEPLIVCLSGVKTEEIRKGRILGGVQGYLEGIFGDPSLTRIPGKT